MLDIVSHYEFKRKSAGVFNSNRVGKTALVRVLNDVGYMDIVSPPESNKAVPIRLVIFLRSDPEVLLVANKQGNASGHCANKLLLVVARRIYKVSEDLFF